MTIKQISWDRGDAEIQLLGGMLGPIRFRLDDGRAVQPMAVAPWAEDEGAEYDELPELLKRLRGEWPCVPFGAPAAPCGLPDHWQPAGPNPVCAEFHGYSGHHEWEVVDESESAITIAAHYPADHAVRRLTRRIAGVPGQACVEVALTIEARREVRTTIALHPVFRLPEAAQKAKLDLGSYDSGRVFPMRVEPGRSWLTPDAAFECLDKVPAGEESVDATRLPLEFDAEELVQVLGASGQATLANEEEGYRVCLKYDPALFPSVLLWISNRGRQSYPWNGRFVALGIEPVRGAFDLGPDVGADPGNPIAAGGHETAILLRPGGPLATRYSIAADSIGTF